MKELIANVYDAVEGCLSINMEEIGFSKKDYIMDLAV